MNGSNALNPVSKEAILIRQGHLCFYCECPLTVHRQNGMDRKTAGMYVFDHLRPRSQGGPNGQINRVASCLACDTRKKKRLPTNLEVQKQLKLLEKNEEIYKMIFARAVQARRDLLVSTRHAADQRA